MNQYIFSSKTRMYLYIAMAVGLISMIFTWINDDAYHTRFWTNLLHNSVFFTMIAVMAAFFLTASILAYAGWVSTFKRIWEAYSLFLIIGISLMLVIGFGVYFHWHHLYHWGDEAAVLEDAVLKGKSSFLNKNWYFFGTLIFGALWIFLVQKIRGLSIDEDKNGNSTYSQHKGMKFYSAILLPLIGFSSSAMIWQWIMSVDAHWYSTLFAWYASASAFVAMISLTILTIIFLKSNGYYKGVNENHLHDLGKYLFAISIFWTYLWFSQFMLIWYANIGEETIYFKERYNNYPVLFFLNLVLNFLVPFFILMRNDTKRKWGSLAIVSILTIFSHWLDYFLMIKPGALITRNEAMHAHGAEAHTEGATEAAHDVTHAVAAHGAEHVSNFVSGFTIPGLLEIGTFIGFLGLFFYFSFWMISRAALMPKNDPYLEESLHHHVV